ncbi:MAG: 1-deoxy-D-xylulose-5-phosphate reductoisomerase [Planctomycetota bacterium]
MHQTIGVAILGATGSIGTSTIDVLQHLQSLADRGEIQTRFELRAISGHSNMELLSRLANQFDTIDSVVVSDPDAAGGMRDLPARVKLHAGHDALQQIATRDDIDIVVSAIIGAAGLESTLAAIDAGHRVALANKETLVVAGPLVHQMNAISQLVPVDSEHSAIFQCFGDAANTGGKCPPRRLVLTASGGPFRDWTAAAMREVTPQQALQHPTWDMGAKITIDSATMMNKALEVIEARWLFDMPAEKIDVVVHPQSIIHSMVEFEDLSVIAQLSPPDMRLPIQYALTFPERLPCCVPPLDRSIPWDLTLRPADPDRFPALQLGFRVARDGGTSGVVVNAAKEAAVDLFLDEQIRFTDIVPAIDAVLQQHTFDASPTLEQLLQLDRWARAEVITWHLAANSNR